MKSCPHCQATYPTHFAVCPQDGTALVETGAWADGTLVRGKYRIVNKVGQGGMGTVYKALHVAFDEVRALKVINPSLMSDELFVKRFQHEAVITRRLQHANAVRVEDIDEAEDGRPFIVMEYIEGRSLKRLIQEEGALPAARVCRIAKQAAAALDAAHQLGMIHRDIKPENIVLVETPQGEQVKVLDFGIAKIKEARASGASGMTLTGTGVVVGTPHYMSPEQAMGKRGEQLDGRSDLYSLGVVMYQMLSAELPFKAETTMQVLLAHMQQLPPPIRTLHPELQIPEAVANLVMRLLEKDPARRPASARVLIEELERAERAPAVAEATRIVPAEAGYSPEAAARALREALAGNLDHWPKPAAPPPAPPRPAPAVPVAAHPAVAAQPQSSRWVMWTALAVMLVVVAGAGAWFVTTQRTAVSPQQQGVRSSSPGFEATQSVPPSSQAVQHPQSENSLASASGAEASSQNASQGGTSPPPNAAVPKRIRVDGQFETPKLISAPKPLYPPLAKMAHIQGTVRLEAVIGTDGTIQNLKVISGHPLLAKAALEAARRWRYQPTTLRGRPVEVVTEIDMNFALDQAAGQAQALPTDEKAVKAAVAMGDLYYDRGEYDNAIREYQRGLSAAPGNSALEDKIAAARKAKAAEQRILESNPR